MAGFSMRDPVRLGILEYVLDLYGNATAADPAPDGKRTYGVDFSRVELGPLGDPDGTKRVVVGVVPGREVKNEEYPIKNNVLELDVQFRLTVNKGDDSPSVMGERLLGAVQQIMLDDETLGGRIILMSELGSEVDTTTYADRSVQGVARFSLTYRQQFQSVYEVTPSV